MEMPPLGTEVTSGNWMVTTGIGSNYPALLNLEIHSTATAAIVTDSHDVLHGTRSSENLLLITPLLFIRVEDNQQKSQGIISLCPRHEQLRTCRAKESKKHKISG